MTTTLAHIEVSLADMRSRYNQAAGQLALLERQRDEKQTALELAQEDIRIWQLVQQLFAKSSEFARQQLVTRVQETVTAALQAVYEKDSRWFEVELSSPGGTPAADWIVVDQYEDTVVESEPETAKGGGISDVVGLALRLAFLELAHPRLDGPVVLDEPGKFINPKYLYMPNLAAFLKQFARATGRQVVMATMEKELIEIAHLGHEIVQGADGISEVRKGVH